MRDSRFNWAESNDLGWILKGLCISFLLCLSLLFLACARGSTNSMDAELSTGGKISLSIAETLRVNLGTEPPTLDWNASSDTVASQILVNVMQGLLDYDIYDSQMKLIPALASKWESFDNSRRWRFTLREDVKWTDGTLFTAQQVLDGWRRLLDPTTASNYSYFLFPIKNASEFNKGKIKDFNQVGVKIISRNLIEVELNRSMSFFPLLLAHPSTYPIRLDIISKFGHQWTSPEHIQTLGAFTLKSWQHDKMLLLERNENYFGTKAHIKYVVAYIIPESGTAIDMFDSGRLDGEDRIPSGEVKILSKRAEYHKMASLMTQFYGINLAKAPMNNPLLRQAISYAIDRQQVTLVLGGGQIPLTSWIPAGVFAHDQKVGIHFDPDKAKDLLKQAGYPDPAKVPKIEIGFNTNEDIQRVAENIQAQLKKNLGLNVELKNQEWKTYLSALKSDPPQIFRYGWMGDYPDPDNFMNVMTSDSDNNYSRWKSKEYDALVEKAAGESHSEKRQDLYLRAQKLLVEREVPVLPLYTGVSQYMIADRVLNYPQNVLQRKEYKGVILK